MQDNVVGKGKIMIAKNTNMYAPCMACLNHQGQKKVVDTYFENEEGLCVVVLFRCQACGGITKEVFQSWSSSYVSGPRKSVY